MKAGMQNVFDLHQHFDHIAIHVGNVVVETNLQWIGQSAGKQTQLCAVDANISKCCKHRFSVLQKTWKKVSSCWRQRVAFGREIYCASLGHSQDTLVVIQNVKLAKCWIPPQRLHTS